MRDIYTYNNLYCSALKPLYYKNIVMKRKNNIIRGIIKEDIEIYENWEYVKYKMYLNISELKDEIHEKQYLKMQI